MLNTFLPSSLANGSHRVVPRRDGVAAAAAAAPLRSSAAVSGGSVVPAAVTAPTPTPTPTPTLSPAPAPAPHPTLAKPAVADADTRTPAPTGTPPPAPADAEAVLMPSRASRSLAQWALSKGHAGPLLVALRAADHDVVQLFGMMRMHLNPPLAEGETVDPQEAAARLEAAFDAFVSESPPFVLNQTDEEARAAFDFIIRQPPLAPPDEDGARAQAERLHEDVAEACGVAIRGLPATTTLIEISTVMEAMRPAFESGDPAALNVGLRTLVDAFLHNARNPHRQTHPEDAEQVGMMFAFLGAAIAAGGARYLAALRECLALQALLMGYFRAG